MVKIFKFFILILLVSCSKGEDFHLKKISDGIYFHFGFHEDANERNKGDICNIGFIIGKKSIAIIDVGGSPTIGKNLLNSVRKHSNLPISHIIISHGHPDHYFGLSAFKEVSAEIVGHSRLVRSLAINHEFYNNLQSNLMKDPSLLKLPMILPTKLVEVNSEYKIDLGDRVLTIKAWPAGHTDNDLTVLDNQSKILIGESIFVDRVPSIRGSILGWTKNLESIMKMDIKKIIPGHGKEMSKDEAIAPMLSYFYRIIAEVRNYHSKNETLKKAQNQIAKQNIEEWLLFEEYHKGNITKAFTELEWE